MQTSLEYFANSVLEDQIEWNLPEATEEMLQWPLELDIKVAS